jgi:hypothetical protein
MDLDRDFVIGSWRTSNIGFAFGSAAFARISDSRTPGTPPPRPPKNRFATWR